MFPGMAIPLRRTRIRAPVHTAPLPTFHGWGLALRSRTGPRQAGGGPERLSMPRLFTAIEIPEAIRLRLSLLRGPLSGAKWIEPENMHITLRFAGDVDGRTADEFVDFLAGVRARPFTVSIAGVGAFGGREPRVLWAGVEAGEPLDAHYRANDRAARGLPGDGTRAGLHDAAVREGALSGSKLSRRAGREVSTAKSRVDSGRCRHPNARLWR